jgi:hypothetical protein
MLSTEKEFRKIKNSTESIQYFNENNEEVYFFESKIKNIKLSYTLKKNNKIILEKFLCIDDFIKENDFLDLIKNKKSKDVFNSNNLKNSLKVKQIKINEIPDSNNLKEKETNKNINTNDLININKKISFEDVFFRSKYLIEKKNIIKNCSMMYNYMNLDFKINFNKEKKFVKGKLNI